MSLLENSEIFRTFEYPDIDNSPATWNIICLTSLVPHRSSTGSPRLFSQYLLRVNDCPRLSHPPGGRSSPPHTPSTLLLSATPHSYLSNHDVTGRLPRASQVVLLLSAQLGNDRASSDTIGSSRRIFVSCVLPTTLPQ